MKILKYIFLTAIVSFSAISCADLDINPVGNNTADKFYTNEIEVKQAIIGTYAHLGRNGTNTDLPTEYYWLASENRSDILYIGGAVSAAQNDQIELRRYLISSNSGTVSTIFARFYQIIKDANYLLYFTKEDQYVRYRAEACFLRAYAYSELARSFGPVALVTKPIEDRDAIALPRASLESIYAQVIKDLEYAAANLDKVYTGTDAGRVGSLAAKTLMAQVYVTMAGYPLNDNTGYSKAESVLAPIMSDLDLRFATKYADIFTLPNENKYDLFSVQFASSTSKLKMGSSLPGYITNSGSGASPFPEWTFSSYGMQGQDVRIDSILVNKMAANNDKRFDATIDSIYWNSLDVTKRELVRRNIVTKFLEKDNTNTKISEWNDFPRNFPILRIADAYLLYAEALVMTNKASLAKPYINNIRNRAGLALLTADPTMDDIKRERKMEFIGEGKRYFDLVRWGETDAVKTLVDFTKYYNEKEPNVHLPTKRDLLLPIPQDELKTRDNWSQNFGY